MNTWKTDAQLQQDVLTELKWDTRVGPTEVGVQVARSVVTLTGTVSSWAKKLAAEAAAHRVAGVHDVANDLVVNLGSDTTRTDTEIAAAVRHALIWDVFVPEDRIQTTVTHGIVTLLGTVDFPAQRDDAARAVGYLAGVCGVDNQIRVKHAEVSKTALQTAILDALERRASRDAGKIELEVDEGRVTVSGRVHSWGERQAVLGAARGTHGVDQVIDKLQVAP
ncbi:MAG: OsmY protein [Deltaproteobacteria bacterium]|nr:OsmY protein [Deltaproteobacteria bacterium]